MIVKMQVSAGAFAGLTLAAGAVHAAPPEHPAYLHALRDVHLAYAAIVSRGGDAAMRPHEQAALSHLHAAADIIRKAAPDDGKNVGYVPSVGVEPGSIGKLHDAKLYIATARSDINEPETDQSAEYLKPQALAQIDAAAQEVDAAILDYQQHR